MKRNALDLGAVSILVEVVDAGSFSAAAGRLEVTKSAVSKRIASLEERLGVRLIQRNGRRLALTEAGTRFHAHALTAIEAVQQAERAATELQDHPRGQLRVIAPMSFGRLHLAPLIAPFLRRYPQIRLDLILDDRVGRILDGDFDVALRPGHLPESSLVTRKVADLHSVLCAAPDYVAAHGAPRSPADLCAHNCLGYSYSVEPDVWHFERDGTTHTVPVAGSCSINNSEALCRVVLDGAGITRLPTFVAGPLLATNELVSLLGEYAMPSKPLHVLYPDRQYLPQKQRVFLDYLVQTLGETGWDR